MSDHHPLTFEAFQKMLAGILHIEPALLQPEAYFITDLNVDSLRLLDMVLTLERLGVPASLESVWRMQTVSDAYTCCRDYLSDASMNSEAG